MIDDLTEDDIAASAATHANGVTPNTLLGEIAQARRKTVEFSARDSGCALVETPDATTLTGEQHLAHLDLQRAARAAQQAQQSFASAQAELKAAMDRWLKANAT